MKMKYLTLFHRIDSVFWDTKSPFEEVYSWRGITVRPDSVGTPYTLRPSPFTLYPTPYALHPIPYTLRPSPFTLHPSPYTLHPIPYTPHPTPYNYTLHPTPFTLLKVSALEDLLRRAADEATQGYLAHKKQRPPSTLHKEYV